MTIIKNTKFLGNYPFRALSPDVVALMERIAKSYPNAGFGVLIKLFECYCDLMGVQVTYLSLSRPSYHQLARGFLGALRSTSFVENSRSSRQACVRTFAGIHNLIRAEIPAMEELRTDKDGMASNVSLWEEYRSKIDDENLRYWNGWGVEVPKGGEYYLSLACLWNSHGQEFTEDFYSHWLLFFKKQARPNYIETNKMVRYLSEHSEDWPAITFQHPQMIKAFFLAFMKDFFLTAHREKLKINGQIRNWRTFIANCEEVFIEPGVWATPYQGGLPKPLERPDSGLGSRKRIGEDGVVVHEKLITPVPLHVTDEEAIEILFHKVETDVSVVKLWAIEQCRQLYSNVKGRKALAKLGQPIVGGGGRQSIEQLGFENICATFEQDGFQSNASYLVSRFGSGNMAEVANRLGLPTAQKLFPYQCLLVIQHPEITHGFLQKLMLFDDNGDFIGYIKEDGGAKLRGYKDRRGKVLSEQVIELTTESQQWIEEIIEITEPLRTALRLVGNPIWKELFITCGLGFSTPIGANQPGWSRSSFEASPSLLEALLDQFAPYKNMLRCDLQDFLQRVSISSIRSSCGVLVYLRTKSVLDMSKALGHARYDSQLLGRYLPASILSFFQTRWIRIFQRSFICEAMKDSPYLLEATDFACMDELHAFLKNHALKAIPSHLKNPENKESTNKNELRDSHIYISIDVGIMTAMLSLEAAVNEADNTHQVCGKAKYWAEISKAISGEIERGNDTLLKQHLHVAKAHINPSRMENIIYVAAA